MADTERNKQLVLRYLEALSGQPKPADLVARYVTDAALIEHIHGIEAAFPRYELIVEDVIAEGDRVAMRGTFRGVHRGAFAGIEPTGSHVSSPLMIVYRVERDRIVEHWLQFDASGLIAQLQQAVA